MKNNKLLSIATTAVIAILSHFTASAEQSDSALNIKPLRPVTSAYQLEYGASRLADTYLTPLIYRGYDLAFSYERWQAMKFDPERWVMRLNIRGDWERAHSPAGNNIMWYAGLNARWSMMRRYNLPYNITVGAGGATGITGGCLYSGAGNNPASAKASWTIDGAGYATWQTRLGKLPVTLGYYLTLPVTGAFFSPEYGELYYEIWLGNRKNLVHWANWSNYMAMDNLVAADLHFGATSLRVGYRGYFLSTHVNNLTTRNVTNSIVVGISGEWMNLNPRKAESPDCKIINALF